MLYRADAEVVKERITKWWQGEDIGRPMMQLQAPRAEPLLDMERMPEPEGWVTSYSISNYAYRVNLYKHQCNQTWFLGDSLPTVSPDLAPNCLALYLGCQGIDQPGTVWCEPCIETPEDAVFQVDEHNRYWQFTLNLARDMLDWGGDKFMLQFPDLIEGLDTLAAMRGSQALLMDLIERPDWVHDSLHQITDLYFHYYDRLYEMFKDDRGGSVFWAWAPGRMCKMQCDFSAMISPAMFGEFMVPVLQRMSARFDHCMYHWDGPGAIPHHDHLLTLEHLDMLQWTPGAGAAPTWDSTWWPLYHKSLEAGKKLYIQCDSLETLQGLRREFGEKLKSFLIGMGVESPEQAEKALQIATF